jgi:hypothetical protein
MEEWAKGVGGGWLVQTGSSCESVPFTNYNLDWRHEILDDVWVLYEGVSDENRA